MHISHGARLIKRTGAKALLFWAAFLMHIVLGHPLCQAQGISEGAEGAEYKLSYRPAAGDHYVCELDSEIQIETSGPGGVRHSNFKQMISWVVDVVQTDGAGSVIQNQTLKDLKFFVDGKPVQALRKDEMIVLSQILDKQIEVGITPALDLNTISLNKDILNEDHPEFRQFLSYYYAAGAYSPDASNHHLHDTWSRDMEMSVPGLPHVITLPLESEFAETFMYEDREYALIKSRLNKDYKFREYVVPSKFFKSFEIGINSQTWISRDKGIPEYNETEIDIQAEMESGNATQPVHITMKSTLYVEAGSETGD